jgi:Tol biopolymer transport system component
MTIKKTIPAALLLSAVVLAIPGTALAAYPGTNGPVAFTSTEDGGARHIFVTSSGGISDLTGASATAWTQVQPRFSPDGREILFTNYGPGLPNTEIWVMGADGQQPTALTATGTGNSDATWSPDGRQIAFVSVRNNDGPNIYVMNTDGTGLHEITHDATGKSELAWSPTGNVIAFVRSPVGGGDREIYSIGVNGSGLTDLSNDPTSDDIEPAWSPAGTQIVYSGPRQPNESVGGDLWVMNADGSGKRALVHENNSYSDGAYPAWSPDGSTIAFTGDNGSGYYHVWSVAAAGGSNSDLVANKLADSNPDDQDTDWGRMPASAAPRTELTKLIVRKRSVSLGLTASGPATGYRCRLRGPGQHGGFRTCRPAAAYAGLKAGRYTLSAVAVAPDEPYTSVQRSFQVR